MQVVAQQTKVIHRGCGRELQVKGQTQVTITPRNVTYNWLVPLFIMYVQWNLYTKDNFGPVIFVLNRARSGPPLRGSEVDNNTQENSCP